MVFGALLSAQDGVQIESSWDRAYEGYLALSASTHHYRMLKKWASVDRQGVYGLMGHVQRNRDVENLLGDAEYAQAADVVSSSAADQLRKRKFQDDRGKAHVMLVKHLVQTDLKPQEMDARLLKVPKAKLQKQMHSVSQGLDHFQDSPTSMAGTRAIHQACNVPHNGKYTPEELDGACISATRTSTSLVYPEGVRAISTERKKGRSRSGRERPNGRRTDFRCCFWLATCSKEVDTACNNEARSSTTSTLASFLPRCLRDFLKKSASLYHRLIEIVILHTKFLQLKISLFLS